MKAADVRKRKQFTIAYVHACEENEDGVMKMKQQAVIKYPKMSCRWANEEE